MKQKGIDVSAQKSRNQSNKQQTQINEEDEEEEEEEEIKSSIQGVNLSTEEGNTLEESKNPGEEEGLDEEPKKEEQIFNGIILCSLQKEVQIRFTMEKPRKIKQAQGEYEDFRLIESDCSILK